MDALCWACNDGPSRVEGHMELAVQTVGDSAMTFRCERCHALWWRTTQPAGGYAWANVTQAMALNAGLGLAVPRPGSHP